MPSTRVNGIELYYEIHGDGPLVLLILGLGVDVNYFADIIRDLATSYRVIAYDPRGAGRSDKPDEPYTMDGMADDAFGLLECLGIGSASVVGCSMGGRTALLLALNHPGLVERLVLVSTSALVPHTRPLTREWLAMDVLSRLPLPKSVDAQPRFAWKRQRQALVGFDCTGRLGEINVPTLVVHGTGDHMVPFRLGRETAERIPGAQLVALPDGHRATFIKHGRRLVEEIKRFVPTS
ncbi:MAG TPA: alpha/beta fold hydrolase [Acidimicrobiales bacterium]